MAFRNSILAGEQLVRTGIRSENYVAGVAGWRFSRDGELEALSALLRGSLITGVGDPRIEVLPDDGTGNPAILFYPDGGGAPSSITLLGGTIFVLQSPDQSNSITITDSGIDLNVNQLEQLRLFVNDFVFEGPGGSVVPGVTLNGEFFDLFRSTDTVRAVPAGNLDVTAAAFAAWSPTAAVTVPGWASRAQVSWTAGNVFATAPGVARWELQCRLDGQDGPSKFCSPSDALRADLSSQDEIFGLSGGAATIAIRGRRDLGATALRVDTTSAFTYQITWLP